MPPPRSSRSTSTPAAASGRAGGRGSTAAAAARRRCAPPVVRTVPPDTGASPRKKIFKKRKEPLEKRIVQDLSLVSHAQQGALARINEGGNAGHANSALESAVHLLERKKTTRSHSPTYWLERKEKQLRIATKRKATLNRAADGAGFYKRRSTPPKNSRNRSPLSVLVPRIALLQSKFISERLRLLRGH